MPISHSEVEVASQPIGVSGPLTDAELRATPVPVSGTVTATPTGTQDVNVTSTVGLTDTQLRATAVPVLGPLTDAELRATPVPVSTTPSVSTVSTVSVITLPASTNTTLLVANTNRRAAIITVAKASTYIKFGSTASDSSYTYKTATANTVIETEIWTGVIDAFGPSGEIAITELA